DRRDKLADAAWRDFGEELGFSRPILEGLTALLADDQGWRASAELTAFFAACEALDISEYLRFDATIVRGLDYYTGTVFEARDPEGRYRAILGGGRYDNLVADVGGDRIPAVGFAMGDVTISLLIQQAGAAPPEPPPPAQILVCWIDEPARLPSLRLASTLRRAGLQAEWYPSADRLPRQLKYADRLKIPLALIVGSRELEQRALTLKDLRDGTQTAVPPEALADRIAALSGWRLP
ncbi:MAG TPA: ATP phosphoribosyltransferase regulatory subunit, partial [Terriglobales bacterium]|nr:ATP phosphoribosyltransferase regulatory subunit [Terriglobales bacterium]